MKIARIEVAGAASWALVDSTARTAAIIEGRFSDWAPRAAVGQRPPTVARLFSLDQVRLLAPVEPSARILGVGMNYQVHIGNLGHAKRPAHTIGYIKPHSALVHPDEPIRYPVTTAELDFEVELVAVLAGPLGDEPHATSALLGYTVGNDISARDAGAALGILDLLGQKALDATTPLGPWIVTMDEFGGPGQPQFTLTLRVNGEQRQHDNTRNMIFPVDELLNYLDCRIALGAGDTIFTGTTAGVAKEDKRWLQSGDEIEAEIEGIGILRNVIGPGRPLPPARRVGRLGLPPTAR